MERKYNIKQALDEIKIPAASKVVPDDSEKIESKGSMQEEGKYC